MTCEQFSALMRGYLDGTLNAESTQQVRQHLETCADCQLSLQILRDCQSLDEGGEVPASFSSSWRQAIKQQEGKPMQPQEQGQKKPKVSQFKRFVAIAASLVVVITGAWMVGSKEPTTASKETYSTIPFEAVGGSAADALRSQPAMPDMAPSAVEYDSAMMAEAAPAPQAEQGDLAPAKIIRTVTLRITTADFDKDLEKLNQLLADKGGYVEYSDISADAGTRRYASFTLRIPKDKLDAYLEGAQGVGRTISFSESQEDVSEQYMDTDTRLATQTAKMERLQDLLSRAVVVEDILRIEREIADTQYQIDRLSGSLRGIDSKVDYATVSLYLAEQRAPQDEPAYTLGQRIANAMADAWSAARDFLEQALIGIIVLAPYVLVLGFVIYIIVKVIKRRKQK